MEPNMIVRAIKHLRDDVCLEANVKVTVAKEALKAREKREFYWNTSTKVVKTVAAGVVVVNALGLFVSLGISSAGSAASASLGGAAQFL
jgi:hypothetical protein